MSLEGHAHACNLPQTAQCLLYPPQTACRSVAPRIQTQTLSKATSCELFASSSNDSVISLKTSVTQQIKLQHPQYKYDPDLKQLCKKVDVMNFILFFRDKFSLSGPPRLPLSHFVSRPLCTRNTFLAFVVEIWAASALPA